MKARMAHGVRRATLSHALPARQRGAAVVMVLFVLTLCTVLIAPLVWQLYALGKTSQVFAQREQAQWLLAGGTDWARVLLREDARTSSTDHLGELWATPLATTPVGASLGLDAQAAWVQGTLVDAQSRFNLRNLGHDVGQAQGWQQAWVRLCGLLGIAPDQAQAMAQQVAASTQAGQALPLQVQQWRGVGAFDENSVQQLQNLVVVLPRVTPINANTAPAELLYAVLDEISWPQAQQMVAQRQRIPYRDLNDVRQAAGPRAVLNHSLLDVSTRYFWVTGQAQVGAAKVQSQALLEREGAAVTILWRQ